MYIIDIKRTPVGKFLGGLSNFSAPELEKPLFAYFLNKYPFLKNKVDEVIIGNVLSAGIGMNPARMAASKGGISEKVPSFTLNQVCASGLTAIIQGNRLIKSGEGELVLSGGMESMSNAPFLVKGIRKGLKYDNKELIDSIKNDGLYCSLSELIMGETAENINKKYKISRKSQDEYSFESHRRAVAAQKHKYFKNEIISIADVDQDESPRKDTSVEKLTLLKPIFRSNGSVTAGNSSGINDGAALSLIASKEALSKFNLNPMVEIVDTVLVGLSPEIMGMGAGVAIEKLLKKNKMKTSDIDLFEINEAFASQVLAVMNELKLDGSRVNIYGGAIAIGHPIGMSGVRIVGSLINGLKRTKGEFGIASLCVGGGQGAAILIKIL
jgi:acetyl-CoA C-acetyltransferase